MGTICAPAYSNIFMAEFEEKYIHLLKICQCYTLDTLTIYLWHAKVIMMI